jgi:DNA-binding MarR family transcriptional regulator
MLAGLTDRLAEGAKVSQALLAQSLGADAMMTSQVLRTLEAAGLIQRERDPGDTRARTLAITEKGAVLLAQALPLLQSAEDTFFDPLGKKEERFTKTLRKLWRKRRHIGMPNAEQPEAKVVELSDEQAKRRRSSRKHAPVGVE